MPMLRTYVRSMHIHNCIHIYAIRMYSTYACTNIHTVYWENFKVVKFHCFRGLANNLKN